MITDCPDKTHHSDEWVVWDYLGEVIHLRGTQAECQAYVIEEGSDDAEGIAANYAMPISAYRRHFSG